METTIGYPPRSRKQIYCTPFFLTVFFSSLFFPTLNRSSLLFAFFFFCLLVFLSFSPRSSRCHVIPQFRWLPPPSSCRRLQQWQTAATAAATRAREHIDARTCTHARTRARHVSVSRQVGIQMDTDVTPVARLSTLYPFSPPVAPLSPCPHLALARTPLDSLFSSFPLAPTRRLLSGMSAVRW